VNRLARLAEVAEALGYALASRRYQLAALLAGSSFALYQLYSTGTVYYDPNPTIIFPQSYPSVVTYRELVLFGFTIPAMALELTPQLTIFVNPEVVLLLVTESLLVATNAALVLLLFDSSRRCKTSDGRGKSLLSSLASIVPGISMLGCCGGAFLSAFAWLGTGIGAVAVSNGSPSSLMLGLVPALVMYANLLWMAPRVPLEGVSAMVSDSGPR
jgi:hypothetical protein